MTPETTATKTLAYGAVGGATALACFGMAPVVLGAYGFSADGVAAGSAAAAWQASIGNVAATSTFAALQSVGAAGFASSTIATSAAIASGTVAGAKALYPKFTSKL